MLTFLVGSAIGLVLGLTGAGGSIMAIPLLVFVLKIPMEEAVGLSLMTVMASALYGVLHRIGSAGIAWAPALIFAVSGALVTPAGLYLSHLLPETYLLSGFIVLMWLVAGRMFWQTLQSPDESRVVRASPEYITEQVKKPVCRLGDEGHLKPTWSCRVTLISLGAVTGLLSGLFGVGGGFLIVPSLVFFTQLALFQAVGTSLVVITIISASGVVSFMGSHFSSLDFGFISVLIAGAIGGMFLGTLLSKRLAGPRLQQIFAMVIMLMSLVIGFKLIQ